IDGSRRYFQLLDVQQLPGNYEKQEHFEADFRGNDVELLVNWEKSGNSLTLVASATAGQPVFAVRQEGRQLVEQHSYFELKGLKFSWLLADYQFVHLPLETLNQALMIESAGVVELACIENCSAPETAFTLLKTRYLLAQSAIDGGNLDAAQMTVRYYADSAALNSADVSRIQVENTRWGYHYVVNVL
ncbi:MAG: DUF3261 domain-containing protein, partial [Sinobacterium sp.]|nr:DUF3261 domain-containing protein [Sinobacterium sp.]